MSYPIEIDKIYRIQNSEGETLDVKAYPEVPDLVCITNSSERSRVYFGDIYLGMEPEFARLLGKALIKCADDLEERKK